MIVALELPMRLVPTLLAAVLSVGSASAAPLVLDFPDTSCATTCSNARPVLQSYGDVPGALDVIYDGNTALAGLQDVLYWGAGYETLPSVAYSQNSSVGMSITFDPAPGFTVTLFGFDIAPYANRIVNTTASIRDSGGAELFSRNYAPLSRDGVTTETGPWSSEDGLVLDFAAPFWNAGVTNIRYGVTPTDGGTTTPIPLPAGGWLLAGALLGLRAWMRR
jgi:hypothetical protein